MEAPEKQLGRRIWAIRRMKGMTQDKLAETININRTYLSHIEHGDSRPQLDTLVLLAQGLRVTLSELFEEIEIEDVWENKPTLRPLPKGIAPR